MKTKAKDAKDDKTVMLVLRLPKKDYETAKQLAKVMDVSMRQLVSQLLRAKAKRWPL